MVQSLHGLGLEYLSVLDFRLLFYV